MADKYEKRYIYEVHYMVLSIGSEEMDMLEHEWEIPPTLAQMNERVQLKHPELSSTGFKVTHHQRVEKMMIARDLEKEVGMKHEEADDILKKYMEE